MRADALIGAAILGLLLGAAPVCAEVLITPAEAGLPNDDTTTRDIYAGPKVVVVSPAGSAVKSPFDLKITFTPRNGANIDLNSLQVIYMKDPSVDLTDRVREYASPEGIDMSDAEVPPGEHRIQIKIKDVDGRVGGTDFSFDVTK